MVGKMRPIHWYVAVVSFLGLGLVAALAGIRGLESIALAPIEFWVFAAFLLIGEFLPVRVPRREEDEEITTSATFAYALVLAFGPTVAALTHVAATLLSELSRRKAWYKATFNAGQYALTVFAAGFIVRLLTGVPHREGAAFDVTDLPAIMAGAAIFFLVNHVLTRTAIALAQEAPLKPSLMIDSSFHGLTTLVMLALSPIVIVAAERSVFLVPLLAVPMLGAYRATGIWLDKQYREHQAMHDPLTALPNRRLFQDRIHQAILTRERMGETQAVMIIDLDRFKEVNDTLGHHVGDRLLQLIGPRLQAMLRRSDTIARLGGDEFAVLLPEVTDAAGAVVVADKLLKALEEPFVIDGLALDIEASIGIAMCPEHGEDVNALMQKADIAMYMAKEAHTGYELYAPERDRHSPQRLALLGELRRAIEEEQFLLHYQPMADMRTGRITAVEALVRWNHPENGMMMPDEFIPLAEHTGLIRPLTMAVLSEALHQCRAWRQIGLDISVSVNLSVRNLQDNDFPEAVSEVLTRFDLPPAALELEITESAIVVDPIRAMGVLGRLSTMGVRLSLDDFGTGYSSLAYLKRLPVSEIKIDKSFVINMGVDEDDAVIVQSTIDLARNLGLIVVAEGVESEEAWGRLASFGCDLAQGYYLSRPVPPDVLTEWLTDEGRVNPSAPRGTAVEAERTA